MRTAFSLLLFIAFLSLLACGTGDIDDEIPVFVDLPILDSDEVGDERTPLYSLSSVDSIRRMPSSVRAVSISGLSNQTISELTAHTQIVELNIASIGALTAAGFEELEDLVNLEILDCQGLALLDNWMPTLAALPDLRVLYFGAQPQVTATGFAEFANATSLQELYIDGSHVFDSWVDEIVSAPNLERLELTNAALLSENAADAIATASNLKRVDLPGISLDDEWLRKLSGLASLEELDVSGSTSITFTGIAHLAALNNLKELNISGCDIQSNWIEEIGALTSLVELRINGMPYIDFQHWDHFEDLVNLETLELADAVLVADHFRVIGTLPMLRKLDLSGTSIDREGTNHLKETNSLVQLFLDGCSGLDHLAVRDLTEIASLRELRFGRREATSFSLGNLSLRYLTEMQQLQNLTIASWPNMSVADSQLFTRSLPNLRRLHLEDCVNINGQIVTYLARADSGLDRLTIRDCPGINANGLREIDRLYNIERLEIRGLADDALMQILSTRTTLKRLDVSDSPVSETGLRRFQGNTTIEQIRIANCPISSTVIEDFRRDNAINVTN